MKKSEENQGTDPEIPAELDAELTALEAREKKARQRDLLSEKITDRQIAIREKSGYWEAVSINAMIDEWRENNAAEYARMRREKREKHVRNTEGRTLRSYEPSTPERRKEQQRISKAAARLNPEYAEAERAANTATRAAKRSAMTDDERKEANRIRREKRAAKKPVL